MLRTGSFLTMSFIPIEFQVDDFPRTETVGADLGEIISHGNEVGTNSVDSNSCADVRCACLLGSSFISKGTKWRRRRFGSSWIFKRTAPSTEPKPGVV